MSLAIKLAGVGVVGLGVLTAVFVGGSGGGATVTLASIDEYKSTGTHKDSFGGVYAHYFLSTEHNDSIWQEKLNSLKNGSLASDSVFQAAKTAAATTPNDTSKIKKACKDKYQTTEETDTTKLGEIWKYCSLGSTKPTAIQSSEAGSDNNKWGKAKESSLISTQDSTNNDWWWGVQEQRLKSEIKNEHKFFSKNKDKSIKEICALAYPTTKPTTNEETSSETAPGKTEILKFCSLKGKE